MTDYTIAGTVDGTGSLDAGAGGSGTHLALVPGGTVDGVGDVSGAPIANRPIRGTVSGTSAITGRLALVLRLLGRTSGTGSVTGNPGGASHSVGGSVIGHGDVVGSLVRESQPAAGAEAHYEATGVRTSLPLLVYALGVLTIADTDGVPADGSFIVAASYVGTPGDPFFEAGAAPFAIGTKVQPSVGSAYYVFRPPVAEEVVWFVPTADLYRFHTDQDSGNTAWQRYRSLPQRSLEGQYAFGIFDPDRIFDYYAKLWGALMYEWGYDNQVLLQFFDPDRVPSRFLAALAAQWGLTLDSSLPLAVRRSKTKHAVPSLKYKGLDRSVRLRLRALGYSGYANEIWVKPTDPGNFQSPALNDRGLPSSSPFGAGTSAREYPHGYRTDDGTSDGYVPSSRVSVHLNDASGAPMSIPLEVRQRVANDLIADVLPAHISVRWFVTDVAVADPPEGVVVSDTLTVTQL